MNAGNGLAISLLVYLSLSKNDMLKKKTNRQKNKQNKTKKKAKRPRKKKKKNLSSKGSRTSDLRR